MLERRKTGDRRQKEEGKKDGIAIRSLAETVTCLHKAHRRRYISDEEFDLHYEFAYNLMNMIVGFKQKIK